MDILLIRLKVNTLEIHQILSPCHGCFLNYITHISSMELLVQKTDHSDMRLPLGIDYGSRNGGLKDFVIYNILSTWNRTHTLLTFEVFA
jgi:hypothetical protein